MSINPQHRFETHFTRKIHDVPNKTKPVIFIRVRLRAIYESRLAAFVSARNCLSSHRLLPFSIRSCPADLVGLVEAAGLPPPLTLDPVEKKKLPN
jgi:hypothetical protein